VTSSPTSTWGGRRFVAALTAIAVGALVIRVVYVLGWHDPSPISGDAYYYHHGANLFADGEGFPQPYWYLQENWDTPGAQHPPLYIVALGIGSLFGFDSFFQHQMLSCLLGAATVVVVGWTGLRLAGPAAGLIAAVIAAVYPNLWLNDALVLSETLVQLTTALVVLTAYRFWTRRDWGSAALLGVMVGLAALTRAETLLLCFALVLPLCLLLRDAAWRRRFALLVVAGAAVVVTIAPWCVYNLARYEKPVLISSGFDLALLVSNCDATFYGPTRGWWSFPCNLPVRPPGDESEQAVVYGEVARDYIDAHRSDLPGVVWARVGRTWGFYQPLGQLHLDVFESRELGASRVGLAMFYGMALLTPVALIRLRRRGLTLLPIVSVVVVVTISSALVYGQTRFRAAAEPVLVVAAAVALAGAVRPRRRPEEIGPRTGTAPAAAATSEPQPGALKVADAATVTGRDLRRYLL
jgi:4-amino-4-deoxy-L-arabinose transferase-like glycosyltransferase